MQIEQRKLHRQLAPILFFPLLATALTGFAYSVGKHWLGIPNSLANLLITVHQGEYLGERLSPVYVLLVGLGLIGLSITGLMLLNSSRNKVNSQESANKYRGLHRFIALTFLLPFAVSAETGVLYRLGSDWFNMSSEQTAVLLKIHQGGYLGSNLGVIYTILVSSSLITLVLTGINMTSLSKGLSIPWQWLKSCPDNVSAKLSSNSHKPIISAVAREEQSDLQEIVTSIRKKAWMGISIFSLAFVAIVYGVVSIAVSRKYSELPANIEVDSVSNIFLLIPIVVLALIIAVTALIITEKLIEYWRRQKEIEANLYQSEATSHTILKAVPDSMLRIHQDGTCLSYIPAKEGESFILRGDIIGKHLTDFLPLTIAQKLIKYAKLALATGKTHKYQFTHTVEGNKQHQEARISAIGETEVLVMIREIGYEEQIDREKDESVEAKELLPLDNVVSQQELIQLLEIILENIDREDRHHMLCCLGVDRQETIYERHDSQAINELLEQITIKIEAYLPHTCQIARLDSNELALLLRDYSVEQASFLAEQLREDLNGFVFEWHGHEYQIGICIGVVEIDSHSSDVDSILGAALAACSIAKQSPASASQNVVLIKYAK